MKVLLAILGICLISLRLLGWFPWSRLDSNTQHPVRRSFLVGLMIFVGVILFVFWLAMR
jgi:hypothetical protein